MSGSLPVMLIVLLYVVAGVVGLVGAMLWEIRYRGAGALTMMLAAAVAATAGGVWGSWEVSGR